MLLACQAPLPLQQAAAPPPACLLVALRPLKRAAQDAEGDPHGYVYAASGVSMWVKLHSNGVDGVQTQRAVY